MCPYFPRRHTVHEQQSARDLTLTWIPGQGVRAVEARAGGVDPARPETYPSEGEPLDGPSQIETQTEALASSWWDR